MVPHRHVCSMPDYTELGIARRDQGVDKPRHSSTTAVSKKRRVCVCLKGYKHTLLSSGGSRRMSFSASAASKAVWVFARSAASPNFLVAPSSSASPLTIYKTRRAMSWAHTTVL